MNKVKSERVHRVFESIYQKYDFMNSLISFNQHKVWRRKAMRLMNVQAGAHVLDVCCGTGDWAVALGRAVGSEGQVNGLDFSQNMLSVARHKIEQAQLDNVQLDHGDAMQLPYADNTFDYVSIGFGLRNVPDYLMVLKEMHRVLKPSGILVCLETSQPTLPVYTQLYFFYFRFVMPMLGKVFANSYHEYAWLQKSTRNFPDKITLVALFKEAGFYSVQFTSLTSGIAAIHQGQKP